MKNFGYAAIFGVLVFLFAALSRIPDNQALGLALLTYIYILVFTTISDRVGAWASCVIERIRR